MTPERFSVIRAIFEEVVEASAEERERILLARCAGDQEVRALIERLLDEDGRSTAPIDGQPLSPAIVSAIAAEAPRPGTGSRIGEFRIIRPLGRGGMGEVFEAEQRNPRRSVAIKLLRADLFSPESHRRFELEAHVLGRLRHPGIACIYEAGVCEQGDTPRPFFAMELIRGRPLDLHLAAMGNSVRPRLELFAKVCEAMEHAHRAGVVHRDLKPSNVLVDETGQPKIVDFGVARLIGEADSVRSMHTVAGQLVGTLAYMSPEQMAGEAHRVDARSDVYALGVMLFELLSGRLPLDVTGRPLAEVARIIREDEPTGLGLVNSVFRGDLDTITAKALEKDPARRYAHAGELAADIRRFLSDEPVVARPPTTIYQIRKFARRHRDLVIGVIAAFIVLIIGLVAVSWLAIRESHQRRLADIRAGEAMRAGYRNAIAAADRSLRLGDGAEATRLLDSTLADARSWEWDYLRLRADHSVLTIQASDLPVRCAVLAPEESRTVWTGDDAGWIRRWSSIDGSLLSEWRGHDAPVAVLIAGQGAQSEMVYSASEAGEVAAWSSEGAAAKWRTRASGEIHDQALLPDASGIAVPMPQRVAILDPSTGIEIRSVALPVANMDCPAIDPNGKTTLCRLRDTLACFEIETGRELWRRAAWRGRFSGDGSTVTLYSGSGRGVLTVDARSGATVSELADVTGLAWGSAGQSIVSVIGPMIRQITPTDGQLELQFSGHAAKVLWFARTGDATMAVTSDEAGVVKLWDTREAAWPFTVAPSNDTVRAGALAGDGSVAAMAGWGCVKVWDLADGAERWSRFVLKREIAAVAFSPDGSNLCAGGTEGVVVVLQGRDGGIVSRTPPLGAPVASLTCRHHAASVLAGLADGRLCEIDPRSGAVLATVETPTGGLFAMAESPDGRHLAIGGPGGAWLRGSAGFQPVTVVDGPAAARGVRGLAFDRTGQRLAVAHADGAVSAGRMATRGRDGLTPLWRAAQPGHGAACRVAFTPDGRRVAVGLESGLVRILDAETGDALVDLREPSSEVLALEFADHHGVLGVICMSPPGACVVFESVRRPALAAQRAWHRQVRALVDRAFNDLHFADAVVAALERDSVQPKALADDAIRLARARGDQPNYLNSDAWAVVRFSGRARADYEMARARAEHAHRSRPEEHAYLNTLAFAELRLGRIDDAIELFNRCVAIPRSDGRPEHPIDQLGLALAHATAGRRELALASLNAARRVIASNSYPPDGELDWFIAEIVASLRSLDAPETTGP